MPLYSSSKFGNSKGVEKESNQLVGYEECCKDSVNVKGKEMECMDFIALDELSEDKGIKEKKKGRDVGNLVYFDDGMKIKSSKNGADCANMDDGGLLNDEDGNLVFKINKISLDDEYDMCVLEVEKKSEDGEVIESHSKKEVDDNTGVIILDKPSEVNGNKKCLVFIGKPQHSKEGFVKKGMKKEGYEGDSMEVMVADIREGGEYKNDRKYNKVEICGSIIQVDSNCVVMVVVKFLDDANGKERELLFKSNEVLKNENLVEGDNVLINKNKSRWLNQKDVKSNDLSVQGDFKKCVKDIQMYISKHNMVKIARIGLAELSRNKVTCGLELDTQFDVLKRKLSHLDVKSVFGHLKNEGLGYVKFDMWKWPTRKK
ncbi:hypothetical protein Tco_1209338 [Tanacetum coccineum]